MGNTTKKSTAKKAETKVVEAVSEETVETAKQVEKRVYNKEDLIPCTSIIDGEFIQIGRRTGIVYRWFDSGETIDIQYQDLLAAILSRSDRAVYQPMFIIEDEELLSQHKAVKELYDSMYSPRDLKKVLDLPIQSMIEKIETMPEGVKKTIGNIAASCIQSGRLDSISKIKELDKILGTNLVVESEIFN